MPFNERIQSCSALVFILLILIAAESIGAFPGINFAAPTPENGTVTSDTSATINVSVTEQNLSEFTWNWNLTNYTFYDDSLLLMMNFDNVSSLGENSTRVVDLSRQGNNGTVYGDALYTSSGKLAELTILMA